MADTDLANFQDAWINPPGQVVGAILASAATITLTNSIHHVSGTAAISNIVPPYTGFLGHVTLIADAAWTLATGGSGINQIAANLTAVAGQAVKLVHDGVEWYPLMMD